MRTNFVKASEASDTDWLEAHNDEEILLQLESADNLLSSVRKQFRLSLKYEDHSQELHDIQIAIIDLVDHVRKVALDIGQAKHPGKGGDLIGER